MLQRALSRGCFAFGAISSVLALTWHVLTIAGRAQASLANERLVVSVFTAYGIVLVITFQKTLGLWRWEPVLPLRPTWVRIARVTLWIAVADFILLAALALVGGLLNQRPIVEWAMPATLSALVLLASIYIAVHWAFRPENLLPKALTSVVSNPVEHMLTRNRSSHKNKPR